MLWLKEETKSWVPFSKYGSTTLTSDFLGRALNWRAGLLSSEHLGTRHLVQALPEAQALRGSLFPWSLPALASVLVSPPRSHLPPERQELQSCVCMCACVHVCMCYVLGHLFVVHLYILKTDVRGTSLPPSSRWGDRLRAGVGSGGCHGKQSTLGSSPSSVPNPRGHLG